MGSNQFRIIVGSYEHNLLCLSLNLDLSTPLFTPIFHFQAHILSIKCLDISKRYLVSGSNDEHIKIYDLQKRKELGTLLNHNGSITTLRFSRSKVTEESPTATTKWMLSASEDNKIIIWRVKDWENFATLTGHTGRINDLDIHPSGRVAVSVSEDHSIRLWNLMTARKAAVLKLRKYNQNGQFVRWCGNDGEFFVVGLKTKVLLFNTATAKVHREIDMGKKTVMHLEVATIDSKEYFCIGTSDGKVEFWETKKLYEEVKEDDEDTEPEFFLQGHSNRVKDFKFYKNEFGHYLVTISSDGKVVVWDMATKEQTAVYDCGERLNCLAVCDESIEKYETVRKRTAEVAGNDEQSEVEADGEDLKRIMLGKKTKKSKKAAKGAKSKKVSIELE
ncbi:HDR188Wp [Eremothecium sinecaudum]|uniref:HDR188Wp n=1 Tax=Eremothecium sinecaudum TaxID=45286 RepID=A0A0X8HT31_9SACH|nr:HDR188Wp [Eremothecium sinecaudum]AMD20930.1 HDR188Wp [Eremothecium sinecaudum]